MDREQAVDALYGERFIIDGEEEKMKEIREVAEAVGEADSAEASIVYFSQDNRERLLQEFAAVFDAGYRAGWHAAVEAFKRELVDA